MRRGSRTPLVLVSVSFGLALLIAAPARATERILLVGDSWAHYVWKRRALQTALNARGLGAAETRGDATAIGGTTASWWVEPANLATVSSELALAPTIDIVHLSVGGNDLFALYRTSLDPAQLSAVIGSIEADIEAIVAHVLAQRADVRVLIVGYDYVNVMDAALAGSSAAQAMWALLGGPTPRQLNDVFVLLEDAKRRIAARTPRCEYLANLGVMQHTYGYDPFFGPGFAPLPGSAPGYAPFPGGVVDLPGPQAGQDRTPSGEIDPIHLSQDGYRILMERAVDEVYAAWLTGGGPAAATPPTSSPAPSGASSAGSGGGGSGGCAMGGPGRPLVPLVLLLAALFALRAAPGRS